MANIVKQTILNNIAEDLNAFGEYDVNTAGGYLERAFARAVGDLWKAKEWAFVVASTTIATTQGNKGPYVMPSDFAGLLQPEEIVRYYAVQTYSMPPNVNDGPNGERYDVTLDRVTNSIYFSEEPGASTYTINYRMTEPDTLNISEIPIPDLPWSREYLTTKTAYYALRNEPEQAAVASNYLQQADLALTKEWATLRRGHTRPNGRTPMNVYGYPLFNDLVGRDNSSWW